MRGALGRRVPPNFEHVEKYPLSAAAVIPKQVPVVLGCNWYSNFDKPQLDNGRWWVGRGGLGAIRGGHAICLKPGQLTDLDNWIDFYDQGPDGACVGFSSSRMMSLLNRARYDARWLWDRAKEVDPWAETNPGDQEGTSVSAAMDILRAKGHVKWADRKTGDPSDWLARETEVPTYSQGINENRWATTVDEIRSVLASPFQDTLQAVPFLNSWGRGGYSHITWMPYAVLERLLNESGEAALVTDR